MSSTLSVTKASLRQGFSLPEVAISLGIAATALLTLISLLPFGLDTLRDSGNKQAEARILQSVIDGFQTGSWISNGVSDSSDVGASLATGPEELTFFYDQTGTEIKSASDISCNYVVRVLLGTSPSLEGDISRNDYLRQVKVRITDHPEGYEEALTDDSGRYRERCVWIARMGQTGPLSSSNALTVTGL